MMRTSRFAVLATTLAGLLIPLLVQPAQAAAPTYVALGDSYSSGTGTRSYLADGTSCQRSTQAYPSLVAAASGYALNLRACSGATVADVTDTQLSALTPATNYVSISVGGNDAGFAGVLTACAQPSWLGNCDRAITNAQAYITSTLPPRLNTLYASIRGRSPQARVVVVGYPRIFNGRDCNAFTWFSSAEMARLNQTADLLNSRLAAAASVAGFSFADATDAFVGRAVCDNPEWINGLSLPVTESFHPKAIGHAGGYTPTVSPLLTGAAVTVTAQVVADAAASGDGQAALQQRYADADRTIEPEVFVAPDLTTPAARRAARKAGIDLDRFVANGRRAAR